MQLSQSRKRGHRYLLLILLGFFLILGCSAVELNAEIVERVVGKFNPDITSETWLHINDRKFISLIKNPIKIIIRLSFSSYIKPLFNAILFCYKYSRHTSL